MGPGLVFFPLLFVDDDPLMARAVHRLLQGGTCDLRTAASVPDAMTLIDSEPAWCGVITDYHLPGGNGLEVVGELRARQPDVPALVVTGDGDPAVTNACVRADVHCVRKPFIVDDLERFLSAVDDYDRGPQGPRFHRLQREVGTTPRETEILRKLLVDSLTQRQTAEALGVSLSTIKTHVARILAKAGAGRVAELRERFARNE